jgi:hypothetical protein
MSIYRDPHRTPPNDILDFAERVTEPATETVSPDGAFASRRKANPADLLLNTTAAWVESLPQDLQPWALCSRFPRIANALSSEWSDPEMSHAYFDELLLDTRGHREGFPNDVLCELIALQAHYESEHPSVESAWQDVS